MSNSISPVIERSYASLWIRLLAFVIDISPPLIVALLFGALTIIQTIGGTDTPTSFLNTATGNPVKSAVSFLLIIYAAFLMFAEGSKWQATLGKRLCKIYVVDAVTGKRIHYLQAFLRFWLNMLLAQFYIGFISYIYAQFFSKEKTAFHDLISRSRVVRGRPIKYE